MDQGQKREELKMPKEVFEGLEGKTHSFQIYPQIPLLW